MEEKKEESLQPAEKPTEGPPPQALPQIAQPRVAPRPHWLTIVIGLLSPTLALVALYMSFTALRGSRESTRRGQQAYINVFPNKLVFFETGVNEKGDLGIVFVETEVWVENAGNTPATIFDTTVEWSLQEFSHLIPVGTTLHTEPIIPLPKGELKPRSSKRSLYRFRLYKDGRELFLPISVADQIQKITGGQKVVGRVAYKTVFGNEMFYATWCWRTTADPATPTDCLVDPDEVHRSLVR